MAKLRYFIIILIAIFFITCTLSNAKKVTFQKQEIKTIDIYKSISNIDRGEMIINVAKHVLPGTNMTLEEWEELIMEWIEHANDIYEGILEFRQVGDIDLVDNTSSNRTAGAINIYGLNWTVAPPGGPGSCYDQTHIRLGQNNMNDTLAHEIGHWFGAIPDGTSDDHGNRTGTYPGFPGFVGCDTDGDGDCDEDDTRNIMFPGTSRTDSQIDPQQADRIRRNAARWLRNIRATVQGNAFSSIDNIGDTEINFIDITDSNVWIENINDEYFMHFTLLLELFVMELEFEMGLYFNSDGDFATGELETGIDYCLGWNGYDSTIELRRCDEGTWIDGENIPIEMIIEKGWTDGPFDPYQIGLSFSFPLSSLIRHGEVGDDFYYYAKTHTSDYDDFSPDHGFFEITYPYPNQAPNPLEINGPPSGSKGIIYDYEFTDCFDPDGDYMTYHVEWGDGAVDEGFVISGGAFTLSHSWKNIGDYSIKAKLIDDCEEDSDWATFNVNIPRYRTQNLFMDMFPILQKIYLLIN